MITREQLICAAVQGLLAAGIYKDKDIAQRAIAIADAVMTEATRAK